MMYYSIKNHGVLILMVILATILMIASGCSREEPTTTMAPEGSKADAPGNQIPPINYDGMIDGIGGSNDNCEAEAAKSGNQSADKSISGIAFLQTIYNTDFVSAGIGGMRDYSSPPNPPGTIVLSGVTGSVSEAYLYWHGPTNSDDPQANADVFVNGQAVSGMNIGYSSDNCWGFLNSQSYVADLTALVQSTGNGNYALTGFGSGSVNTNGASLIVFFDDGDDSNDRDVSIFHGNDSNTANIYDDDGWNVTLDGINYQDGTANMQLHIADGQNWADDALLINDTVKFEGGWLYYPDLFSWATGLTVSSANNSPEPQWDNLWDIINFEVTTDLVAAGPAPQTLELISGDFSDCLSLIVALVDLPAGAGPDNILIDIKPGSDPNAINCENAREIIPVAILTSDDFDALTVDHTTVEFEGATEYHRHKVTGVPQRHEEDIDEDGDIDLVFHFRLSDTTISCDSTEGRLTGETYSGMPIAGTDSVVIVPVGDDQDVEFEQ
jgi:hypothetical protein